MSDYTRGDDPIYDGFREGWKCPCDAKEETDELWEMVGNIPLDRLEVICDAERDGRCVVLPVHYGTTCYRTIHKHSGRGQNKEQRFVQRIEFKPSDIGDFGRTVFLTEAEARNALEGGKVNG